MSNHLNKQNDRADFRCHSKRVKQRRNRICFGLLGKLEGQLGKLAEQKTKLGIVINPCFRHLGHKSFCSLPIFEPI